VTLTRTNVEKNLTQDISLRDVQEVFVGDVSKSLVKCYNERDVKNVSQRDVFVSAVNVQATPHSYQFTPVQTQNYTFRHNEKMSMS